MTSSPSEKHASLGLYVALIACAYTSTAGVTTIYSLLSRLYRDFDDPFGVGWVVSSYYLVSAIAAAVCGRFGDLLGRRRMTLIVLPVAAVGALVSGASNSLGGVIAGSAVQGVAGALTPLALGIVRESVPAARVPFAVGVVTAALVGGGGASFLVAGLVIDHYSWTGGFYMKVVLAILSIAAVLAWVPDLRRPGTLLAQVDVFTGILFAPAVAGLFIAVQLAQERGWGDPLVLGVASSAVLATVLWARHQARQAVPLIDVRLLARREVLLGILCFVFLALGCMQEGQILPLFLQQPTWTRTGFGMTAAASGVVMMSLLAISLVVSPASGAVAARRGLRQVTMYGFVIGAAGWAVLGLMHQSFAFFIAGSVLVALCIAVSQTTAYGVLIEAAGEAQTSEVIGLAKVVLSLCMGIGAQIVTVLLATSRVGGVAPGAGTFPDDSAYMRVFVFVGVMSVCGIVTAWALSRRVPQTDAGSSRQSINTTR